MRRPARRRPGRRLLAAGCAALLAGLAGCADGRPEQPGQTEPAAAPATSATASPAPGPTDVESAPAPATEEPAFGAYGVGAGHPEAVAAGMAVLQDGGNAVDAAVAAAFAMAVVEPLSSGPGGGGAALVVPMPGSTAAGHPDEPLAYDYREVVSSSGVVPPSGTGVPGFVAGMELLHQEHGVLPWPDVLAPAIGLAEDGVPVSRFVAQELRSDRGRAATAGLEQFTTASGRPLAEDDLLVQPALGDTLQTLADDGAGAFYTADLAQELAELDGIDVESLAGYEVDVRSPARGPVGDHEVLAAAPALSGVGLVQLLQVAEAAGVAEEAAGSATYIDTMTDAWRVADASLQTVLGDPRFVDVPVEELTDPRANAGLAEEAAGAAPAGRPAAGSTTTHLSVVDASGLAVSMTNTITNFWGSGQEVGGFFVNDHLIRFGMGTTSANVPDPGRRPASYMTPAVLLDDEQRPVLVLGSPGGRRIPNIVATVIARWALHDQPIQQAVDAPRFHLEGDLMLVEDLPGDVSAGLAEMGYALSPVAPSSSLFGSVQALELDHGTGDLTGAADTRRTGAWDATASRRRR